MNTYERALKKFGETAQTIKAIEELAELSVQLAKGLNGLPTTDLEGEIADAIIMIEQLKLIYPSWKYAFNRKMSKLEEIL